MQQTQLYVAAPDPAQFPSIAFGLKESFIERGASCIPVPVPLPLSNGTLDESFQAAIGDAKNRTQQYAPAEYSVYLTGGSVVFTNDERRDFALIIALRQTRVIYATVEPARFCSPEESKVLASLSAGIQKFCPMDGASKTEREEGKRLAETVLQGVAIGLDLADGTYVTDRYHFA